MEYVGNILYDDKLFKEEQIIIYGAGFYGKKILQYLKLNGKCEDIVGFCDANENFKQKCIEEFLVYQPKSIFSKYPDAAYLISGKYTEEMYGILKKNGITKIHILFV